MWQTEKLLQGKHKGFFLGSYRLLRPLGKGGMVPAWAAAWSANAVFGVIGAGWFLTLRR